MRLNQIFVGNTLFGVERKVYGVEKRGKYIGVRLKGFGVIEFSVKGIFGNRLRSGIYEVVDEFVGLHTLEGIECAHIERTVGYCDYVDVCSVGNFDCGIFVGYVLCFGDIAKRNYFF